MTSESDFERARQKAKAAGFKISVTSTPQVDADVPDALTFAAAKTFPVAALPRELRDWVQATAMFHQTPQSMCATFAIMAAMTAAAHRTVHIRSGWEEPTVSQIMLLAAPSERKSPGFKAAMVPIYQWTKREHTRHKAEQKAIQDEIDALLVDADGKADPAEKAPARAKLVKKLKADLERVRPPMRRIADDVTPEAFMRIMHANGGLQCLVSDEADVFQSFGGRYNQGEAKLAPLLKGWDASSPLVYDRVGQGHAGAVTISILDPRVGIAIAGQHATLDVLLSNRAYRDKGMLARMLFVVLGERQCERLLNPPHGAQAINDDYNMAITALFDPVQPGEVLRLKNLVDHGNGWLVPAWLYALRGRVETGLLGAGEFAAIPDWAGKLVSNMARIAAVLELLGGGGEQELTDMCEFFIAHAKRAFGVQLGSSKSPAPQVGVEQDVLAALVQALGKHFPPLPVPAGALLSLSLPFSSRDGLRRSPQLIRLAGTERFLAHMDRLIELGYAREVGNPDAQSVANKASARRFVLVHPMGPQAEQSAPVSDIPTSMPAGARYDEFDDIFDN